MRTLVGPQARLLRAFARVSFSALAAVALLVSSNAHAQAPLAPAPPVFRTVDANGVDLQTGAYNLSTMDVAIGQPGAGGLAYVRSYIGPGWRDNYIGTINSAGSVYTVSVGGMSETFTLSGGSFTSDQARGATLVHDSGAGTYTYTTANGAVVLFDTALANGGASFDANVARVTSLTTPNGEALTFHYKSVTAQGTPALRLQSVTNNLGYQLHFEYSLNNPTLSSQLNAWRTLTKVTGINNAVDYCNPTADTCTGLTQTWPNATYAVSAPYETVTDTLGRTTRYGFHQWGISSIRYPSSTTDPQVTMYVNGAGQVSHVSYGLNTWQYAYASNGSEFTVTVEDPNDNTRVVVSDLTTRQVLTDTNELGDTISYQYDGNDRLTRITVPEGNYSAFTYDARGNVTEVRQVAKSGSGLSDIVATASYPGSCANPVTCNLPSSTTDPLSNTTDYTYDATHGGVLTVTLPDPDGGGALVRPETRYAYTSLYAYYKNSGGGIVAATSPVYRLTQVSSCATSSWSGSACNAGNADETRVTIDYGSNGVANNRLPVSTTSASGDGSLTATTAATYDTVSNLLTVNGPLSGTDDTTRYRYDAGRQLIGVVGPDPDGGSALKHRALRLSYNADGQVTLAEQGTVDSQSDGHWAAFASLQQQTTGYDFLGRPILRTMTANSATHSVMQMSYDTMGRLDCTALRLNPAMFAALPASACSLGAAGADGPDRIARNTYDDASRLSEVTLGYATPAALDEWTATFTDNGQLATLADASGNLTTNEYDGFDRLARIRFPNTSGGGSSTTDDELYAYNAASAVTLVTRRDGATLTTAYDNLMRPTGVTPSANGAAISYSYDNFSRPLTAAISGHTLTYGYDQLSRLLSEQSPQGTVAYQYDLASRRTRITWPDSFCAQYAYDLYAAVTQISAEGGSCTTTSLASYNYDNLGRRVSVSRGNGTSETLAFDNAGRLDELTQNLDGSSQDVTFEYDYNAAGGIVGREISNSSFVFAPLSPATTSYADNGLNQYTSVGGTGQSYDARGNLTTGSFSYDIFNRLTGGPSSATLSYDPQGRLYETVGGGTTTRFLYDGAQIIGEYDGSNALQRRYVPGPALDEHAAWYEGSGTSDRQWFAADERGSIVAVLNASGAATSINTYDEYGLRGSSNAGRFQFTGQAWLPEVSLYHFRARAYAPTTGRFLQTDPILTAGGMNLYAYVGNDPMNATDPLGLCEYWAFTSNGSVGGISDKGTWIQPIGCESRRGMPGAFMGLGSGGGINRQDREGGGGALRHLETLGRDPEVNAPGGVPLTQCQRDALAPFVPQSALDAARLHLGTIQGYMLPDMPGQNMDATTRGNDIYFRASSAPPLDLLGHEVYHVYQYQMGLTESAYLLAAGVARLGGGDPHSDNPHEQIPTLVGDMVANAVRGGLSCP